MHFVRLLIFGGLSLAVCTPAPVVAAPPEIWEFSTPFRSSDTSDRSNPSNSGGRDPNRHDRKAHTQSDDAFQTPGVAWLPPSPSYHPEPASSPVYEPEPITNRSYPDGAAEIANFSYENRDAGGDGDGQVTNLFYGGAHGQVRNLSYGDGQVTNLSYAGGRGPNVADFGPLERSPIQHPWVVPAERPIAWTGAASSAGLGACGCAQDDPWNSAGPASCGNACGCGGLSPCCRPFTFRDDFRRFGGMLWHDAQNAVNWNNALLLGAAAGGALAIRHDLDRRVRESTARHPRRWGGASDTLSTLGEPEVTIPVLLGVYGLSLWRQDDELHSLSGTLISAYTLTTASTLLIKVAADTSRPSNQSAGGRYGFPSYHTSSTFALAAVLDEYYGPGIGLPAYATAGMIGWSRIDTRNHDLSDVVFGAALGFVIGKSVAGTHLRNDGRVRILPYLHPDEPASGVMFETRF